MKELERKHLTGNDLDSIVSEDPFSLCLLLWSLCSLVASVSTGSSGRHCGGWSWQCERFTGQLNPQTAKEVPGIDGVGGGSSPFVRNSDSGLVCEWGL